jgi:hypothetical protein
MPFQIHLKSPIKPCTTVLSLCCLELVGIPCYVKHLERSSKNSVSNKVVNSNEDLGQWKIWQAASDIVSLTEDVLIVQCHEIQVNSLLSVVKESMVQPGDPRVKCYAEIIASTGKPVYIIFNAPAMGRRSRDTGCIYVYLSIDHGRRLNPFENLWFFWRIWGIWM